MSMVDDEPARRDLVVIGASAGGVEALRQVVADLPADLAAAVCVVLHLAPGSPSALAPILQRAGRLSCRAAEDGDELVPGRILVAPPDRHLLVEDGGVTLTTGPRENGHRPAVDPLFRSAARARGGRVIGVVLSGTRDDGAAGLSVISAHGGATIVQDPEEALYAGMPNSALAHVAVDAVVPSTGVASTIAAMVRGDDLPPGTRSSPGPAAVAQAEPLTTICPECGGVLSERIEGGMTQWGCRVGHRYSPDSLIDAQSEDVEAALWAAVRALEDREAMLIRMASKAREGMQKHSASAFRERALAASESANRVREILSRLTMTALRTVDNAGVDAADEESAA